MTTTRPDVIAPVASTATTSDVATNSKVNGGGTLKTQRTIGASSAATRPAATLSSSVRSTAIATMIDSGSTRRLVG
jgi:hypothetical protein